MAVNVAQLVATLALDDSDLQYGLQRVNRMLQDQNTAAQAAAQGLRNIETAGRDIATLGRTLSIGITLPIVALGAAALKASADMDQMYRALEAVTGSASGAAMQIERLITIGKDPGIGFPEAVRGAINLQNAGFSAKEAAGTIRELGNAVALSGHGVAELAMTERALQNIAARGQVTNREIRQLALHIPQIRELMGAVYGTMDPAKISQSGISGVQFVRDMVEAMSHLPRVQQTIHSEMDNLRDSALRAFGQIGEAAGTRGLIKHIEGLENAIEGAAHLFAALPENVRTNIVTFGALAAVVGPVTFLFGTLINSAMQLRSGFVAILNIGRTLTTWWAAKAAATLADNTATMASTAALAANTAAMSANTGATQANAVAQGARATAAAAGTAGSIAQSGFLIPGMAGWIGSRFLGPGAAGIAPMMAGTQQAGAAWAASAGTYAAGTAAMQTGMSGALSNIGAGLGFGALAAEVAPPVAMAAAIGIPAAGFAQEFANAQGASAKNDKVKEALARGDITPQMASALKRKIVRDELLAPDRQPFHGTPFAPFAQAIYGGQLRAARGRAAERPGDTDLIHQAEIDTEAAELERERKHQEEVLHSIKYKGLTPGPKAQKEFARARAEQFRAEYEEAQASMENVDEQKRPAEEAKRLMPMLAARRQVLAKEAEALKPLIATDSKAAEDYYRIQQDIGRLHLDETRLQQRAMKARELQHKQALTQSIQNRDLIRNIAVSQVESQIGIAPEHMRAQVESQGMEPIIREAQADIRRQQIDLTHEKRTPQVVSEYLRLELEYWKREQEIQRLKRSAAQEITANQNRAQKEQEQAGQAKLNAELDFQRLRATNAPEGEDAQANVQMVVPVLQDIMADQIKALQETEPGSKEYWDGVREIIKIEGQIQQYQNSAIKERKAAQKKLETEAKQNRAEQREGLELETRLMERQMENIPFLTEQQKRRAMMPALLRQYKELSTPIPGETRNESLRRELDAENLRGEIQKGAGFSRDNFARTIGGGRIFTGDVRFTRGVIGELDRIRRGARGQQQPALPPGTPVTPEGGHPDSPAAASSPFSPSYTAAMEYNRMNRVHIGRGTTLADLDATAAMRKREADMGYQKAHGTTIINNNVVLNGNDREARKKQFEDLWNQVEDALYHPIGSIPGKP